MKSEDKIERPNKHKLLFVNLPRQHPMSGKLKGRNVIKREGITTVKLVMKNTRGAQYKVKRVTIDDMNGWEGWQILNSHSSEVYIRNGSDTIGYLYQLTGHFKLRGQKILYNAEGWDIAQAIRFAYIMTQKPNYENLTS